MKHAPSLPPEFARVLRKVSLLGNTLWQRNCRRPHFIRFCSRRRRTHTSNVQNYTGLCILFYLSVAKCSLTLLRVQWSLETRHSATSSFRLKLVVEPLVPGHALMDTLFKIENSRWRITDSNKVKSYHEFSLFNMVILLPINFYPNPTMKVPLQLLLQAYYSVTSSEHRVKK